MNDEFSNEINEIYEDEQKNINNDINEVKEDREDFIKTEDNNVKDINKKEKKKSGLTIWTKKFVKLIISGIIFGLAAAFMILFVNTFFGTSFANRGLKIGSDLKDGAIVNIDKSGNADFKSALDVSDIAQMGMPSVVAINVENEYTTNSWFFGQQTFQTKSSGSGIIIGKNDKELLIVTNNHVIQNNKDIKVVFIDDTEVKASVKGGDTAKDIAIIAVSNEDIPKETLAKINIAKIGNYDDLKVGQGVVAIGNALGYGQSVTVGYISALDRHLETDEKGTIDGLLQTDAAINPGNSGGALLNMKGEVIAINSAKYSSTDVEGMGYAIPISNVIDIITELSSKEARDKVPEEKQGVIGIKGQNINTEMSKAYDIPVGVYVYSIVDGSAAASSDLKEKDIIVKFAGETVRNMDDIKDKLSYYKAGETVELTVQRLKDSKYEEVKVSIQLQGK